MKSHLIEGFDYDLWANLQWVECLPNLPFADKAKEILHHIAKAQQIWVERSYGSGETPVLTDNLKENFQLTTTAWKELIDICDPNAYVAYEREGVIHHQMIVDIARHVINHGTYHRGHLRGLCDAAGITNFPETDYIRYIRETH